MSENPFGELPDVNPYAPPAAHAGSGASKNPLLIPAIFLLALASLFALLILASLPSQIIRIRAIDTSTPAGVGELTGSVGSLAVWLLNTVTIALGSVSMIQMKNYQLAQTAAILSVIPFCSPCFVLGIPFGIWALILLNRPDVKQRFRH